VDLLELAFNLLPVATFTVAVEDVVVVVDAPNVHAEVSANRNLLELAFNLLPVAT